MPGFALLAVLKSPLVRYVIVGLAAVSWAYLQGRSDCGARHARQAARMAQEWADKLEQANAAAYARGLQAARLEARNKALVEGIAEDAKKELGAGDICLSADLVERLRQLGAG